MPNATVQQTCWHKALNSQDVCIKQLGALCEASEAAAAMFRTTSAGQEKLDCVLLDTFEASSDQLHVAPDTVKPKLMVCAVMFGAGVANG